MTALRTILPPIKLDLVDHYGKYDLSSVDNQSDRYELIIEECNRILDYHVFIQNWINQHHLEEGDCWNVSSICAHYLSWKGYIPYLFGIDGDFIAHLECASYVGGGLYRFWHVEPYNEIGHFVFTASSPVSVDLWKFAWGLYLLANYGTINVSFLELGSVENGYDARNQIDGAFPNNVSIVKLVSLEKVTQVFEDGDYSDES
jgi:hypothetical protein